MGVGAGPYMYVVVVQKFTFAISSPDEFLLLYVTAGVSGALCIERMVVVTVAYNYAHDS